MSEETPVLTMQEQQKLYREKNRDKLNAYHKNYYQKNKQKLLDDHVYKKIFCSACGKEYSKSNMAKHVKTKLHNKRKDLKKNN